MLKTFVVSLKNEIDRRFNIGNILNNLCLDFVFFDAINPSENPDWYSFYSADLALRRYGRNLTKGELGCNLSHHLIYEIIVANDISYSLILEDDALVRGDIKEFIELLLKKKLEWDVIILGYSKISESNYFKTNIMNPIGKFIFKFCEYRVGVVSKNYTVGTVGYMISKSGAKKLKESNLKGACLADDWELYQKTVGLNIYHCRPFLVFEDFEKFESSISIEREKISKKSPRKFVFEVIRYIRGYFRKIKLWF